MGLTGRISLMQFLVLFDSYVVVNPSNIFYNHAIMLLIVQSPNPCCYG